MAISDETLALAIPPELKTDHPDAALVVQGILIAIAANENSGAMTAKGRMRDTFAALQSVFFPIFQAHIAKEDEDWGALKQEAEKAKSMPPVIDIARGRSWFGGERFVARGKTQAGEEFEFYVWYGGESPGDTRVTMDKENPADGSSENIGSLRIQGRLQPKAAISTIAAENGFVVVFSGKAKELLYLPSETKDTDPASATASDPRPSVQE